MVKNQTLYDIFTEYRNGNKDILNKLFDIKRQEDEMRSVVCTVPDVNRMVKCAYRCYSLNGMSLKGQFKGAILQIFLQCFQWFRGRYDEHFCRDFAGYIF